MNNPFERKSLAFWVDGNACFDEGFLNSASHSLYYAVLQAVYGFAEANDLLDEYDKDEEGREVSKHKIVRKIVERFNRGHQDKFLRALHRLRLARAKADYHHEDVTELDIQPCLKDAKTLREFFISYQLKAKTTE